MTTNTESDGITGIMGSLGLTESIRQILKYIVAHKFGMILFSDTFL